MKKSRLIYSWLLVILMAFQLNAQSIELDKQLGAENAKEVEATMGIVDNPELNAYVNRVGQRLVAQLDDRQFDYSFQVVDDPIPNAFALPGGYVYVTRGILAIVASEDELAGVMGHEIIHAHKRHAIKQIKKSIVPRLLEVPGNLVGNVFGESVGVILNAPLKTTNDLILADYSRSYESESDVLGVQLAAKAGYDPFALQDQLIRLSKSVEFLTDQKEEKSYFADHPFTPDRVRTINETAAELKWKKIQNESTDFPQPLDGLLFGYNPSLGVVEDSLFLHPELNVELVFPGGWLVTNEPQAVTAIDEEHQSAIVMAMSEYEGSPKEIANAFEKQIKDEYRVKDLDSKPFELNGEKGHVVTIKDNSGDIAMYMHVAWINVSGHLFQLSAVAPVDQQDLLIASLESFKPLSDKNRQSIKKMVFRVFSAYEGQTIAEICKNAKTPISPDLIAFINNYESASVQLAKGERLKVIVREDY